MGIIEQLYNGQINPSVRGYPNTAAMNKVREHSNRYYDALMEKLNDEEKELFEKFLDAQGEAEGLYHYDVFSYGFKLGALLMGKVFGE